MKREAVHFQGTAAWEGTDIGMRHTTKDHSGLLLPGGDRPHREGLSCGGDRLGRRRRPLAAAKGVENGERAGGAGLKAPLFFSAVLDDREVGRQAESGVYALPGSDWAGPGAR